MTNSVFIDRVINLTNQERARAGLAPLQANPLLAQSAQTHTANMALQDFFDHTGRDGSTAGSRIAATGYQFSLVAENIGAGYRTPEEVVNGWMNSPGHRANILNPNLREIGVGFYYLQNDTGTTNFNYYWTQNFGTPLSTVPSTPPTPPQPPTPQPVAIEGMTLNGSDENDSMVGSAGGDRMLGLGGNDLIAGNDGHDELYGNQGNDRITGDNGNDTIHGGQGSDNLLGNDGNDALYGNKGMDTLFGGNGNDLLFGGQDNDLLLGDAGNDTLKGDFGNDTLTGGPGTDVFVLTAGAGADTITDYDDAEDFLAFAGEAVPLNVVASGNNTLIQVASSGELLATLLGVNPSLITASDFVPV